MPIKPFLRDFKCDPDDVGALGVALEKACKALGLVAGRNVSMTEFVARQIIEVARGGERDSDRLCQRALDAIRKRAMPQ